MKKQRRFRIGQDVIIARPKYPDGKAYGCYKGRKATIVGYDGSGYFKWRIELRDLTHLFVNSEELNHA